MKEENNKKHPPKINDECYSEIVTDFSKILNKYNLTSTPKEHIEILKSVIDVVFYSEESSNLYKLQEVKRFLKDHLYMRHYPKKCVSY